MKKYLKYCLIGSLAISIPLSLSAAEDVYDSLNLFGSVFERVRSDYVEEVPDSKMIEAAINGMLTSLDPHSSYLNEDSFKEMQVQTKGEFGGLGIEVTMENGLVKVVSPIDDTPAFAAGIKAGDLVSHIDDEAVMGMTLSDAVAKMRGPVNTEVKLSVLREGETEPLEFRLKRAVIKIRSARSRLEGDIIYLRLTSFTEQSYDLLKAELEKQMKAMPTAKGIVLDLRNNPGGLLDQAISVSDAFLEKGEVVSTRGRDPANTKRYNSRPGDLANGMNMVVLINNGSASAAEIVAGALQDHKRAIVMGTKSFGKGSVQTVIPLPGHGAMRLTTARYYTPSGHSIQAKGIEPDIIVEEAKIEPVKKSGGFQLEADLRGRLQNEEEAAKEKEERAKKTPEELEKEKQERDKQLLQMLNEKDKEKAKDGKKASSSELSDIPAKDDYQLSRALDLLRSLSIYKQAQSATN